MVGVGKMAELMYYNIFLRGQGCPHSRRAKANVPVFKLQLPQRVVISRTAILGICPPGQVAANWG